MLVFTLASCGGKKEQKPASTAPNEVVTLLSTMKTSRAGFSDKAVGDDVIKTIVQCGINAPSAQNKQPWHFTAIVSKEMQDKLRTALAANMPKGGPGAPAGQPGPAPAGAPAGQPVPGGQAAPAGQPAPGGQPGPAPAGTPAGQAGPAPAGGPGARDPFDKAPVVIVISGTKDWRWSTFDCALACEAMSAAAVSLGLGTHIVMGPVDTLGGPNAAEYQKLLGIPADKVPVAVLLLGYPPEKTDSVSRASDRNQNAYNIIR